MTVNLTEYKELYLETSEQLLNDIERLISELNSPDSQHAVADLHRFSHSLKSQSLVMGYTQIGLAGRLLESLFLAVQENQIILTDELIYKITRLIRNMKDSLEMIKTNQGEINLSKEIEDIEHSTPVTLLS